MVRILIIDDDPLVRNSFSRLFIDEGHEVLSAGNLSKGIQEAGTGVDVIYLDLQLPDGDGVHAIDTLSNSPGQPEIIVITGLGAGYGAMQSVESNAWDYITKPASPQVILKSLESALEYRRKSKKNLTVIPDLDRCGIIGDSPAILRTIKDVEKSSKSGAGVLLRGETGVGKELVARAIHQNSERKDGPFIVVDCSSLTESLIESTLYGHVKGAFTDARSDRVGLVGAANGGTLFLDEIGELPLALQKSFLRVLQEHRFRSVGSGKEQMSDFRLVSATNRDLEGMVQEKTFRSDLFFRIRTIEIVIPPLREREKDIETLLCHLIRQNSDRYGLDEKEISEELLRVARSYAWPGNVREMKNALEAAVIQAGSDSIIYPKHLPNHIRLAFIKNECYQPASNKKAIQQAPNRVWEINSESPCITTFEEHKANRDREYFTLLMKTVEHDIGKASLISGLSIPSIYRYLSITGIPTKK